MRYRITKRQYDNARRLGVYIEPSRRKNKKIDVYSKNGQEYIASIGDIRYADYDIYLKTKGKEFADSRRKAYKSRHQKDRKVWRSAGYYADKILW